MARRYFHCHNSNRVIGGFTFTTYGNIGGCLMGTYATENAAEQARIDELLKEPRNAIEEMSEEDYARIQKKSPNSGLTPSRRSPIPVESSPVPPAVANASPVVTSNLGAPVPLAPAAVPVVAPVAEPAATLPAAVDAVVTGDVEPSQKPKPSARRKARRANVEPTEN